MKTNKKLMKAENNAVKKLSVSPVKSTKASEVCPVPSVS